MAKTRQESFPPHTTHQPHLSARHADHIQNYVDRNAIAQARLNNLEKDLGMTGVQFNTTVSILFVGYVLMQVPSNMLITRIKPGIYMSAWMLVWAVVSGCTALVQSFGGLVACRFFLGITEAPFYPGATYMLSIFYTRKGLWTPSTGREMWPSGERC